eukprot:PhM_4_TR18503/c0_g1_i2/m.25449
MRNVVHALITFLVSAFIFSNVFLASRVDGASSLLCPYGIDSGNRFTSWQSNNNNNNTAADVCTLCPQGMVTYGACSSNSTECSDVLSINTSSSSSSRFCRAGEIILNSSTSSTNLTECPAQHALVGFLCSNTNRSKSAVCKPLDTAHNTLLHEDVKDVSLFCPEGYVATGQNKTLLRCTKIKFLTSSLSQFPCATAPFVLGVLGDGRSVNYNNNSNSKSPPAGVFHVPGYAFPITSPRGVHFDSGTNYVLTFSGDQKQQRIVGTQKPFAGFGHSTYVSNELGAFTKSGDVVTLMMGSLFTANTLYVATDANRLYFMTHIAGSPSSLDIKNMSSAGEAYSCKIQSLAQASPQSVSVCFANGCVIQKEPSRVDSKPFAYSSFAGLPNDCTTNKDVKLSDAHADVSTSTNPLYGPVCLAHTSFSESAKAYTVESRTGWIRSIFNSVISPELVTASEYLKGATSCAYRASEKVIYITMPTCVLMFSTVSKQLTAIAGRCHRSASASSHSYSDYVSVGDAVFVHLTALYIHSTSLYVVDTGADRVLMISNLQMNPRGVPLTPTVTLTPSRDSSTPTETLSSSKSRTRIPPPTPTASPTNSKSSTITTTVSPSMLTMTNHKSQSQSLSQSPTHSKTSSLGTPTKSMTSTHTSSASQSVSIDTATHSKSPSQSISLSMTLRLTPSASPTNSDSPTISTTPNTNSISVSLGTPTKLDSNTHTSSASKSDTIGTVTMTSTDMFTRCALHVDGPLDGTALSLKAIEPRPRISLDVIGKLLPRD